MTKEELIRDEDYSEKDAEIMVLQNKIDRLKEENEILKHNWNELKENIKKSYEYYSQLEEDTELDFEENCERYISALEDKIIKTCMGSVLSKMQEIESGKNE